MQVIQIIDRRLNVIVVPFAPFRLNFEGSQCFPDIRESLEGFIHIRLLSDMMNHYAQHSLGFVFPAFMFLNLTYSITLTIIGTDTLPLYIYIFFPCTLLCSIMLLMYLVTALASVHANSEAAVWNAQKAQARLTVSDRVTSQYVRRVVKAQRPFGFRLSIFCYVSVGTAQDIMMNAISSALLAITVVNEAMG